MIILVLYWFVSGSFIGGDIYGDLIFLIFLGIRISGVIITPITDKREISVAILYIQIFPVVLMVLID